MTRAALIVGVLALAASPTATAQTPKAQVAAVVTAYVMSTFTTTGVPVDYFRVIKTKVGKGGGTVWFTLAANHGRAYRYKARVICAPVPGTARACFSTRPVVIT